MSLLRHVFVVPLLLLSFQARADGPQTWDVAREVPPLTIIGPKNAEYEAFARQARAGMIEALSYWRDVGLPDPPQLEGVYVFSDPSTNTIQDILEVLNPTLGKAGLIDHMRRQYEALANSQALDAAAQILGKVPFVKSMPRDELITMLFDQYCAIRYGFAVRDTWGAVNEGRTFANSEPFGDSPRRDNAFYGRFPRLDLTDLLRPSGAHGSRAGLFKGPINEEAYREAAISEAAESLYSRRIVILPRTTEGSGASDLLEISSLADQTIANHEQGHHANSTLAENMGALNRMLEEIFADYHVVAPSGDPVIGRFFALASGKIAARLRAQPKMTANEAALAASLEKTADKGYLRGFDDESNIDLVKRHWDLSNPYNGGDPGRTFLWNVRERLSAPDRRRFDAMTVETIAELGHLPLVITTRSALKVLIRDRIQDVISRKLGARYRGQFFARPSAHRDEIMATARDLLARHAGIQRVLKAQPDEAKRRETAARLLTLLEDQVVTKDGYNVRVAINQRVTKALEHAERRTRLGQNALAALGVARTRPAVEADYVLPEFFRAFYRNARRRTPDLLDIVVDEAERAMKSTAIPFTMPDGTDELAFVRHWASFGYQAGRDRVARTLGELHALRAEITRLKSAEYETPRARAQALREPLARYATHLERMHEFERTGALTRLYAPSPWLASAQGALKVMNNVLARANSLSALCSDWLER